MHESSPRDQTRDPASRRPIAAVRNFHPQHGAHQLRHRPSARTPRPNITSQSTRDRTQDVHDSSGPALGTLRRGIELLASIPSIPAAGVCVALPAGRRLCASAARRQADRAGDPVVLLHSAQQHRVVVLVEPRLDGTSAVGDSFFPRPGVSHLDAAADGRDWLDPGLRAGHVEQPFRIIPGAQRI